MMRFTGRPLGAAAHGGMRTTATQKVQFFKDNPTTTTIRWYAVPEDRPVIPFPSVFQNEVWLNEVPLLLGMEYGKLPGQQGVKAGGPHYERRDPVDVYNPHHFCGTQAQWGGDLLFARPEDQGSLLCCTEPPSGEFNGFAVLTVEPRSLWSAGSEFGGSASVALSAGSAWSAEDTFNGGVTVTIEPFSAWRLSTSFDGSVSATLLAGSAWLESATLDGSVSVALLASSAWTTGGDSFYFNGVVTAALTAESLWQQSYPVNGYVTAQLYPLGFFVQSYPVGGLVVMRLAPSSGWSYSPVIGPGDSCESAGSMDLGTTYGPFTLTGVDWWAFPVVGGVTYHVVTTVSGGAFGAFAFSGDCSGLSLAGSAGGGLCFSFVAPATGFIHVELIPSGGTTPDYTILADTGTCP